MDGTTQWINHYLVDNSIIFGRLYIQWIVSYLLDNARVERVGFFLLETFAKKTMEIFLSGIFCLKILQAICSH